MATIEAYRIDPACLAFDGACETRPLVFVDLDKLASEPPRLPPVPVIGLGDPGHPAARWVDAVVEPPVSAQSLIDQATRHPNAAALCAQLLRSLEGVAVEHALTVESLSYGLLQGSAEHTAWLNARPLARTPDPPGEILMEREGSRLRVVIDRAPARNAIDRALRDGLFEAFTMAALDLDIQHVELRSTGAAFCVGGDLAEFGVTRDPATAHAIRCRTLPALPLSRRADIVDVHVQGACVGAGLEMAAFARRVTAAPTAWFQLPELAMGLIPGAGGCVSVPRRIGRRRAALMILSGRRINAATALRWGLIDGVEERAEP